MKFFKNVKLILIVKIFILIINLNKNYYLISNNFLIDTNTIYTHFEDFFYPSSLDFP